MLLLLLLLLVLPIQYHGKGNRISTAVNVRVNVDHRMFVRLYKNTTDTTTVLVSIESSASM